MEGVRRDGVETCAAKIVYVTVAPDGSGERPVPAALRSVLCAPHGIDEARSG
ncbi:hypothetical protein [Dactylosporangium maewongense]|uniref:hypothetical protein n=1 Tax=Dactylosporangium maewongense TaxID=634393 RepID=UPI0031DFC77B